MPPLMWKMLELELSEDLTTTVGGKDVVRMW